MIVLLQLSTSSGWSGALHDYVMRGANKAKSEKDKTEASMKAFMEWTYSTSSKGIIPDSLAKAHAQVRMVLFISDCW